MDSPVLIHLKSLAPVAGIEILYMYRKTTKHQIAYIHENLNATGNCNANEIEKIPGIPLLPIRKARSRRERVISAIHLIHDVLFIRGAKYGVD